MNSLAEFFQSQEMGIATIPFKQGTGKLCGQSLAHTWWVEATVPAQAIRPQNPHPQPGCVLLPGC